MAATYDQRRISCRCLSPLRHVTQTDYCAFLDAVCRTAAMVRPFSCCEAECVDNAGKASAPAGKASRYSSKSPCLVKPATNNATGLQRNTPARGHMAFSTEFECQAILMELFDNSKQPSDGCHQKMSLLVQADLPPLYLLHFVRRK